MTYVVHVEKPSAISCYERDWWAIMLEGALRPRHPMMTGFELDCYEELEGIYVRKLDEALLRVLS